jgi:hypothetical protein
VKKSEKKAKGSWNYEVWLSENAYSEILPDIDSRFDDTDAA